MERDWLGKLSHSENVARLIRSALGCTCPQEVFEHYQVQLTESGYLPMVQMVMGNKLLVWIINVKRIRDPEKEISALLDRGRLERERRHLNRFRLVLIGGMPESRGKELISWASSFDDKVHLHILPGF